MNKKLYTILYILISTVVNILMTLLIIAALIAGSYAIMRFGLKLDDTSSAYPSVFLLCFVGGMIINFFINKAISAKLIVRFGMDGKFEDKWFSKKKTGVATVSSVNEDGEEVQRETVLPSSVLPDDDELENEEKWGK